MFEKISHTPEGSVQPHEKGREVGADSRGSRIPAHTLGVKLHRFGVIPSYLSSLHCLKG